MQHKYDGEDEKPFRVPVSAENVAIGRLGRIYQALDRKNGRMLAVECIDLAGAVEKSEEHCTPSMVVQQILEDEVTVVGRGDLGRHVFFYDAVHCSSSRIYLRSPSSVVRTLAAVQQDFGQLHPLAVKQYIYQVVRGLSTLHKHGFYCGGVRVCFVGASSLMDHTFIEEFDEITVVDALMVIVVGARSWRPSFESPSSSDLEALDVRSVAYVMLEMLTGLRARGALMEKDNLLAKVQASSPEHQFLCGLLASSPLEKLLEHPYFWSVYPATTASLHSSSQAAQEQHHIIGVLTKQELTKCQSMKREYLQQIRVWQAQFEKKYQRKPKTVDRPAGIVRLQGRCQALVDRMQDLNHRLAIAHASVYQMIPATAEKGVLAIDASSQRCLEPNGQEDTSDSAPNSPGKRSPAQKAFLNRFGAKH